MRPFPGIMQQVRPLVLFMLVLQGAELSFQSCACFFAALR